MAFTDGKFYILVGVTTLLLLEFGWAVRRVLKELDELPEGINARRGFSIWKYEDVSDFQWFGFRDALPATVTIAMAHILITHIVSRIVPTSRGLRAFIQAFLGVAASVYLHGQDSLIVLAIVLIYYSISSLTKHESTRMIGLTMTWTLSIFILMSNTAVLEIPGAASTLKRILGMESDAGSGLAGDTFYPVRRSINILLLKLISFNVDRSNRCRSPSPPTIKKVPSPPDRERTSTTVEYERFISRHRPSQDYNLLFLLAYVYFMPLYVAGPVLSFNAFCHALSVRTTVKRRWLFMAVTRWIAIFLVTEILFTRILLISALGVERIDFTIWDRFHLFEVVTMGGLILLYTWCKFVVLWSGFRIWSISSGVYCTANLTKFLYDYYSCQKFWKDWHASYHRWMLRYMYFPLGGSRRKLLATVLIFGFAAVWHRANVRFAGWAVITILTFVIELSAERLLDVRLGRKMLVIPLDKRGKVYVVGEIVATLLIVANLAGFGCGLRGLWYVVRRSAANIDECVMCTIFFVLLGYIHVRYLIERDINRSQQQLRSLK